MFSTASLFPPFLRFYTAKIFYTLYTFYTVNFSPDLSMSQFPHHPRR